MILLTLYPVCCLAIETRIGMGLSFSKFSLDLAYQFRFGKNVGKIMIQARDFSEEIDVSATKLTKVIIVLGVDPSQSNSTHSA
jgi:hypothetical protein